MANRVFPLTAVLLAIISTLTQNTSAASVDKLKACPAGEVPECRISVEYKTILEKYPHQYNCDWYFYCSDGVAYCLQCEEGTIYNPETERCDNSVRIGCIVETTSDSPPITTESTTLQPTTPSPLPPNTTTATTPASNTTAPAPPTPEVTTIPPPTPESTIPPTESHLQCPACARDGPTFRHPTNCQWFYECTNGIPVLRQCFGGLHWNARLQVCDYPCLAGCSVESQSTPVGVVTPDGGETTICPTAEAPACPAQDPKMAVLLAHPTSCEWYFECSNGIPYCMPCPAGEHFNPKLKVCDYPEHAGCGTADLILKNNEEPPKEDIPSKPETTPGNDKPSPAIQEPHPSANGVENVCPAAEAPACPVQDPRMAVLLAHPTSCEWYFECSNGIPYCMPCPAGEHFNPKLKVCDYPEHAGCGTDYVIPNINVEPPNEDIPSKPEPSSGIDKPSLSIQQPDPPANSVKNVCPAAEAPACPAQDPRMAVLLAHPTSCEWYFECSNGIPYCMPCPVGEYFNPKLKVCDYPENSGCGASSGTIQETESRNEITAGVGSGSGSKTVSETGSGSRIGNEVQTVCPAAESPSCSSGDFLAHPTSCSWYFQCSNGIPYCMPCPAGLYFNDKLKVCDYPEKSGCKISN